MKWSRSTSRCLMGYGTSMCIGVVLLIAGPVLAQKRVHSIHFEGTDHELSVYRIYGENPGKTLLLIGGIQGDEPGGFLSADQYADISLIQGNLIVVPRANFQSIVLKRRKINEDMNRKFAEERGLAPCQPQGQIVQTPQGPMMIMPRQLQGIPQPQPWESMRRQASDLPALRDIQTQTCWQASDLPAIRDIQTQTEACQP